jgi:hypothetical protein
VDAGPVETVGSASAQLAVSGPQASPALQSDNGQDQRQFNATDTADTAGARLTTPTTDSAQSTNLLVANTPNTRPGQSACESDASELIDAAL